MKNLAADIQLSEEEIKYVGELIANRVKTGKDSFDFTKRNLLFMEKTLNILFKLNNALERIEEYKKNV